MKGCEFRELRKKTGLRQSEVAEILKVTRETVVHWETKNGGQWEVSVGWSEAMLGLSRDIRRFESIKRNRKPRKTVPMTEKIARRLRKIDAAVSDQ
jgi:transcriptional regulator with XRE-family HTH domain